MGISLRRKCCIRGFNFYDDVLIPLIRSAESESAFKELMETLYAKRLIDIDDYTLAIL